MQDCISNTQVFANGETKVSCHTHFSSYLPYTIRVQDWDDIAQCIKELFEDMVAGMPFEELQIKHLIAKDSSVCKEAYNVIVSKLHEYEKISQLVVDAHYSSQAPCMGANTDVAYAIGAQMRIRGVAGHSTVNTPRIRIVVCKQYGNWRIVAFDVITFSRRSADMKRRILS